MAQIASRWQISNETNTDGSTNFIMKIFAQPTVNSMFANVTCRAKIDHNKSEVSKLIKIAMPPSVIMSIKATKVIYNRNKAKLRLLNKLCIKNLEFSSFVMLLVIQNPKFYITILKEGK